MFNPFKFEVSSVLDGLALQITPRTIRIPLRSRVHAEIMLTRFGGSLPVRMKNESDFDYNNRVTAWFETILQSLLRGESNLFNSQSQRLLREDLTSDPFLSGINGQRGTNNIDIIYNNRFPPASSRNTNRQRTWEAIPIACVIYVVCQCIASDELTREKLNSYAAKNYYAPSLLQELINSNRRSRCGNFDIIPVFESLSTDLLDIAELTSTIFDLDFLRTDQGLSMLFSFFARLHMHPDNYIKMTPLKSVNINSGFTTTLNALSLEPITWSSSSSPEAVTVRRAERTLSNKIEGSDIVLTQQIPAPIPPYSSEFEVNLLPGHSYPRNPHECHVYDSFIMHRQLLQDSGENQFFIGFFSPVGMLDYSTDNLATYVALRGSHNLSNRSFQKDDKLTDSSNNFDEKLNDSKQDKTSSLTDQSVKRKPKKFNNKLDSFKFQGSRKVKQLFNLLLNLFEARRLNQRQFIKLSLALID